MPLCEIVYYDSKRKYIYIYTNSIDIILRTAEQIYKKLYNISTKQYENLSVHISIVFCQ